MFTFLKRYLFNKELANAIHSNKIIDRFYKGSTQIETVSVLYQTSGLFDLEKIDNFIHQLETQNIDVRVLCYSDQSFEKGKRPSTIFTKKELGFSQLPKKEVVGDFNYYQADLFYNLLDPNLPFTGYMNLMNRSKFRVSLSANEYGGDLMVKINDNKLQTFLMTTDHILNNMSKNKNEKSKV